MDPSIANLIAMMVQQQLQAAPIQNVAAAANDNANVVPLQGPAFPTPYTRTILPGVKFGRPPGGMRPLTGANSNSEASK